jgi:hypothetical protein
VQHNARDISESKTTGRSEQEVSGSMLFRVIHTWRALANVPLSSNGDGARDTAYLVIDRGW